MKPLIKFKKTTRTLLIPLAVICFGLAPMVQAAGPDTEGSILGSNNGEGVGVLVSRTSGVWNTGTGFEALNSLTSGNQNTATGLRALFSDINGGFNTATGVYSLYSNTAGFFNSATGAYSLTNNTTGSNNTANGYSALYFNTTGTDNTAIGFDALRKNTTGTFNSAVGDSALRNNTTGGGNNAFGSRALLDNTTGQFNTALGRSALEANTIGNLNIAIGDFALSANVTGSKNTAIGDFAGSDITGSGNVNIGADVSTPGGVDNETRIRNIYTTVQPVVGIDPDFVTVNSAGRLGRGAVSSRRYKHDIKPMDKASEALFKLNPVSFRYNKEYDATQTIAFGLIAEDVAEVYPDLVGRNPEGQPESVRYEQINAMLLNEFLKGHAKMEQLKRDFESKIAGQQKQIEALTAGLQKVSAQIELSKPAPRTVGNN